MTKNKQFIKNIDLSEKLANYIAKNPKEVENLPENASFVTFSFADDELNLENKILIESLRKEGKKVVKAEQTGDRKTPWKFTQGSA